MKEITLFLVDDYLLTRIANKINFESDKSFAVLGDFKNASDCISALKKYQPDIILMDLDLSDIDGIEACKIICKKYPMVKVIILTAYEDDAKILTSIASGASAYIIKGKTDIKKAVKMVAEGSFLIDLKLAHSAFSKIPVPENLENIYQCDTIKKNLTKRELEVLKLLIEGKTNSQIAKEIVVSTNTAKAHVGSILEKFGAKDRVQAAVMAVRANLF